MSESTIKVSIVGATSYTGNELIRLLVLHPNVHFVNLTSESLAGTLVSNAISTLRHDKKLNKKMRFTSINNLECSDIIFSCLPAGILPKYAEPLLTKSKFIINLAGDYRFDDVDVLKKHYPNSLLYPFPNHREYLIPEFTKKMIEHGIINLPGCMAAAGFYAVYPLIKHDLVHEEIILDVKTGSSGAGKSSKENHSERVSNFRPHKIHGHRHGPEIVMAINKWANKVIDLHFSTYSLDVSRGILASAYSTLKDNVSESDVQRAFYQEYESTRFIRYLNGKKLNFSHPMTKTVLGTNYVEVSTSVLKKRCVSIATLDNLTKGASGQAVQVMNNIFNFPEETALNLNGYLV